MSQGDWVKVCGLEDIPVLGARVLKHDGGDVAVFRTAVDRVFAIEDRCPHRGGPLSQGIVAGDRVTCPLHGWQIELGSGQACSPDEGCARRYEVRLDGDVVFVAL